MITLLTLALLAQDLSAQIDEAVGKLVRADGPGAAVLVMSRGTVLHKKGYGLASIEHRVPVTSATMFDLASVSKQFTAMAVLMLAEQGKLALADDARKHLPELAEHSAERPIRIEDLLRHTTGIPDYLGMLAKVKGDPDKLTNKDILDLVAREKLLFATGTKWQYSNSNYVLLALVVERVSGKTFGAFARESIFEPIGMKSTVLFDDPGRVIPNRASGYARTSRGVKAAHSDLTNTGDGAVFTCLDDWVQWELELRKPTLVKPETLRSAWTAGKLDDGTAHTYGYGWLVATRDGKTFVEHGGGWVGFLSHVTRDVDGGVSIAVFCNSSPGAQPGVIARRIAALLPAAEQKEY